MSTPEAQRPAMFEPDGVAIPLRPDLAEERVQPLRIGERRDSLTRRWLAVGDLTAVAVAAAIAAFVGGPPGQRADLFLTVLPTLPAWLLAFKLYRLYDRDAKRISHSSLDDLPPLFHSLVIGTLLLWAYTKVAPVSQLTLAEVATFGASALLGVLILRSLVRNAVPRVLGPENVLLAGRRASVQPLIRKFREHPGYSLVAVGRLAREDEPVGARHTDDVPCVGDEEALAGSVARLGVSRLVIDRPSFSSAQVLEMIQICRDLGVKVSILPGAVDALGPATEVDEIEGIPVLGLNPPALGKSSRWLKRLFDLVIAGPLLIVLLPFCPIVALAIKLDSPGPVFFKQTRVGRGGRRFVLRKLRTMSADADGERAALLAVSRDPNWLLLDHDPRVTRVGRFLRRSSVDELPQLWNVVRGEMSLVGPRPLPEYEDARIDGWERTRLDLTPGITGLWQVLGRTRIPFAEMVKLDYIYVTNWSLWLDFKLLLQTFPVVVRRRGVN